MSSVPLPLGLKQEAKLPVKDSQPRCRLKSPIASLKERKAGRTRLLSIIQLCAVTLKQDVAFPQRSQARHQEARGKAASAVADGRPVWRLAAASGPLAEEKSPHSHLRAGRVSSPPPLPHCALDAGHTAGQGQWPCVMPEHAASTGTSRLSSSASVLKPAEPGFSREWTEKA